MMVPHDDDDDDDDDDDYRDDDYRGAARKQGRGRQVGKKKGTRNALGGTKGKAAGRME